MGLSFAIGRRRPSEMTAGRLSDFASLRFQTASPLYIYNGEAADIAFEYI
ncbi:hypothetical protein [Kingella potus]|nr:hypothetical protein [Kingella potus]UOO99952.1 hypothetical protein LVJ84_07820 [Kingella potus]